MSCKHDWRFISNDTLRCERCGQETRAPLQKHAHDTTITNSIQFFKSVSNGPSIEVLRIYKDGIWVNPEVPVEEAAQAVLRALDNNIKQIVEREIQEEREACAKVCETVGAEYDDQEIYAAWCANAIRARGQS